MLRPHDPGPIYFETDLTRFPVEPWNAASNLIFLFTCIYFFFKLRHSRAQLEIIKFGLPMLALGFIGGTVFHATRSSVIWLVLDFVPIMILSVAASFHFLLLLLGRPWKAALGVGALFIAVRALRSSAALPMQFRISFGYALMACSILLPAVLYCATKGWRRFGYILAAAVSFSIAIHCRLSDSQGLLPMGTHFLWHLFGGLSTFLLLNYIYLEGEERAALAASSAAA